MIECNACGGLMVVTHTRQTKRGEYKRFACKACDNRVSIFGGVEHVNVKPVRMPSSSRRLSAAAVFAIRESVEKNRSGVPRPAAS
jgi:DNA-directed RNA polymerase subunit M/transcription elongation factor TFIIS